MTFNQVVKRYWFALTVLGVSCMVEQYPPAIPALNGPPEPVPASGYTWKKTDLTYSFANCPTTLDCERAHAAVRQAFAQWDDATVFSLTEKSDSGDIVVTWGAGAVEDQYPFDGVGGEVAHAAHPYAGGDWWFDGDIFLDDAETWVDTKPTKPFPKQVHLQSVALHEIGHALGLTHVKSRSSIMWAYYTGVRGLTQDAITAVQTLYGAPDLATRTPAP